MSSSDKRVILVTGANKGIGFEAVRILSEKLPASTILLGTRSQTNGEAALTKLRAPGQYSNIQLLIIDVTDKQSLASAVEEVKSKYGHLDVLINNGGISNVDGDSMHRGILDVNFYGVKDCIEAFLPILSPNAALVTVSSEVGAWTTSRCSPELQSTLLNPSSLTFSILDSLGQAFLAQEPSSGWPAPEKTFGAYGISKALVSAYMRNLALTHPEVRVAVVCPGYCATDLNHNSGYRTAVQGGESVVWPVLNDGKWQSGQFFQDGDEHSWNSPPPAQFA
jgi:NAD(P)-dependent dehydrogenase (short-subunit alcohol dehydrogenase family)